MYGGGVVEKEGEFEGVHYSIDIFDGFPIEFKTTRAKVAISEHWLRQLIYYMLATNSKIGLLQVQRITPRGENPFPAYLVRFNENQRAEWLEDYRVRANKFKEALEKQNPALLPIYRGEKEWVCRECPYRKVCDRMEGLN
jgi:hypothetical protein